VVSSIVIEKNFFFPNQDLCLFHLAKSLLLQWRHRSSMNELQPLTGLGSIQLNSVTSSESPVPSLPPPLIPTPAALLRSQSQLLSLATCKSMLLSFLNRKVLFIRLISLLVKQNYYAHCISQWKLLYLITILYFFPLFVITIQRPLKITK